MLRFGDAQHFAIEVAPERPQPFPRWAHVRFHCAGQLIGDFSRLDAPASVALHLRELCSNLPRLWRRTWASKTWQEIFVELDQLLYLSDEAPDSISPAEHEELRNADFLTNWAESFDGYKGFAWSPPGQGVELAWRAPGGSLHTAMVPEQAFASAVREFAAYCDQDSRADA